MLFLASCMAEWRIWPFPLFLKSLQGPSSNLNEAVVPSEPLTLGWSFK